MKDLTITTAGDITNFEPREARALVTAHNAAAKVEERNQNVDKAISHTEKALAIQRAFVLWWDAQGNTGGNPTVTDRLRLEDVAPDLDRMTLSRWRTSLVGAKPDDTSKFDKAMQQAIDKIRKACGFTSTTHVSNNSGENEWYTPAEYISAATAVMGAIELDPASCPLANITVDADMFFTKDDDGLAQEWRGAVWMNPPYSRPLVSQFVDKLIDEIKAQRVTAAIVLTNNFTDTESGQKLMEHATAVCFPHKRIKFIDGDGSPSGAPLQGQMFTYFGDDPGGFHREFSFFGSVLCPLQ